MAHSERRNYFTKHSVVVRNSFSGILQVELNINYKYLWCTKFSIGISKWTTYMLHKYEEIYHYLLASDFH